MCKFTFQDTCIPGCVVIEPTVYGDERGYFLETWNYNDFSKAGLPITFVQDNQSFSKKGVLRGLHYQKTKPQGKLVRVTHGEIFDVAVDIRKNSSTFGKWYGIYLSAENKKQLYVPEGCAHGFMVISDKAEFLYKCTQFYNPSDEGGLIWNDPTVGIEWPTQGLEVSLNDRDSGFPGLLEIDD